MLEQSRQEKAAQKMITVNYTGKVIIWQLNIFIMSAAFSY